MPVNYNAAVSDSVIELLSYMQVSAGDFQLGVKVPHVFRCLRETVQQFTVLRRTQRACVGIAHSL